MVATPHRKGDFTNFHEQGSALLRPNPQPQTTTYHEPDTLPYPTVFPVP